MLEVTVLVPCNPEINEGTWKTISRYRVGEDGNVNRIEFVPFNRRLLANGGPGFRIGIRDWNTLKEEGWTILVFCGSIRDVMRELYQQGEFGESDEMVCLVNRLEKSGADTGIIAEKFLFHSVLDESVFDSKRMDLLLEQILRTELEDDSSLVFWC